MKESELLGKLMPGLPDILAIIENVREKYQIPEVAIVSITSKIKSKRPAQASLFAKEFESCLFSRTLPPLGLQYHKFQYTESHRKRPAFRGGKASEQLPLGVLSHLLPAFYE
jgi:hypothetical protein